MEKTTDTPSRVKCAHENPSNTVVSLPASYEIRTEGGDYSRNSLTLNPLLTIFIPRVISQLQETHRRQLARSSYLPHITPISFYAQTEVALRATKLLFTPAKAKRSVRNTREITATDYVVQFIRECESRKLSPKTISRYQWALDKLTSRFDYLPTSRQDLVELLAIPGLNDVSSKDVWRTLRMFYKWCASVHGLPNAMESVRPPLVHKKLPRFLEEHEVEHLLEVTTDPRDYAMVALILDTGIRIAELAGLRASDILPRSLLIREEGAKGGKERIVPLSLEVRQMLLDLAGDDGTIWHSLPPHKGPVGVSGCNHAIMRILRRAGFHPPKAGPHLLRHTMGTLYVAGGGDLAKLKEILGHEDIKSTMIYVTLNQRMVHDRHEEFSPYSRISKRREEQSHEE